MLADRAAAALLALGPLPIMFAERAALAFPALYAMSLMLANRAPSAFLAHIFQLHVMTEVGPGFCPKSPTLETIPCFQ